MNGQIKQSMSNQIKWSALEKVRSIFRRRVVDVMVDVRQISEIRIINNTKAIPSNSKRTEL